MLRPLLTCALALLSLTPFSATSFDLNGDGIVSQADPQALAAGLLAQQTTQPAYDVNGDGKIDVADLVYTLNALKQYPANPVDVAPASLPTVSTPFNDLIDFLYEGAAPLQAPVASGTIDPLRVAVLRGRVLSRASDPLPGVTVEVLNHAEYGHTFSRLDGWFDLAVNANDPLVLKFSKSGYLSAQRSTTTEWNKFIKVEETRLVQLDPVVTQVNLAATTSAMQTHTGSTTNDGDGMRSSTLMFSPGTGASMQLPDGTTVPLDHLAVRSTEYTVGSGGLAAMPANLPPQIAYTYCVELSVDQALTSNAAQVTFTQPVLHYVENFLHFPVGQPVPSGYYDRQRGVWVPAPNGRIIKILSTAGGVAQVDINGFGNAANSGELAALGMTSAEQQSLAAKYASGQELWRIPISHFSPWDHNWPFGPPNDATPPSNNPPRSDDPPDDCDCLEGSKLEMQSQILGTEIPLTVTPYQLVYRSNRIPGRTATSKTFFQLSNPTVPASLKRIDVSVELAGQLTTATLAPAGNASFTYDWDGKNAYGQTLNGVQHGHAQVAFVYDGVYGSASRFGQLAGVLNIQGDLTRQEVSLNRYIDFNASVPNIRGTGMAGWDLDIHHTYDPSGKVLTQGDGARRSVASINSVANVVAGVRRSLAFYPKGLKSLTDDGTTASQANLGNVWGVAAAPDGSFYFSDPDSNCIYQSRGSFIYRIAGTGQPGFGGDAGPATSATLSKPLGLALAPDGKLYIADWGNNRIRCVDTNTHRITTVAGNGSNVFSGDGGLATSAGVRNPVNVNMGLDGSLLIADANDQRVRRVDTAGIIDTLAGNGSAGFSGDGGLAVNAQLNFPSGVAQGPNGSYYIADTGNGTVRRVKPNGIIDSFAGNGIPCNGNSCGDGLPASQVQLIAPESIQVAHNGAVYFTEPGAYRVRIVGGDGMISTLAGSGAFCTDPQGGCGDHGPAPGANLGAGVDGPQGLALAPDGGVFISDGPNGRIIKTEPPLPGFEATQLAIPSLDGSQLFKFDGAGRHLSTYHTATGALVYQFQYDSAGRLTFVTDGDGNVTKLNRDATGNLTGITGPHNQTASIGLDANGYLASVSNPGASPYTMQYGTGGLLTALTNPRGNTTFWEYDSQGRLTKETDAEGGVMQLARTDVSGDEYNVTATNSAGKSATFGYRLEAGGDKTFTYTYPSGIGAKVTEFTDGRKEVRWPSGEVQSERRAPDPRWGMQAPYSTDRSMITPSGIGWNMQLFREVSLSDPKDPLKVDADADQFTANGNSFTRFYIGSERTITEISPTGVTRKTQIDAQGRIVTSQLGDFAVQHYAYDAKGRLAASLRGDGITTRAMTYAYDSAGRFAQQVNARNNALQQQYDAAGHVNKRVGYGGAQTLLALDGMNNLVSLTPPGRTAHQFTYNKVDLVTEYLPPAVDANDPSTRYTYDADQNLQTITHPGGPVQTLSYNAAGQVSGLAMPNGNYTFNYQPTGGLLSNATSPDGITTAYQYDGPLVTRFTWGGGISGVVNLAYSNGFRLAAVGVAGGTTTTLSYDAAEQVSTIGPMVITRSNTNGLITEINTGQLKEVYNYNAFAEPDSYTVTYGGAPLYSAYYTRTVEGKIAQKSEVIQGTAVTSNYTYDASGRLASVDNGALTRFGYGVNDNRTSTTVNGGSPTLAAYDAQDRLTQMGSIAFTHNLIGQRTGTGGSLTASYGWDVVGNLKSATVGGTAVTYAYDGRNRRMRRQQGGVVTKWLYQAPLQLAAELDGSDNVVSQFVYGTRGFTPDLLIKGGQTYRYISDQVGSPRLLVNVSTGQVAQRLDYDAFGKVTQDTSPDFQPIGFAGGLYDATTGFVRFGAREYDAATGRFTARDPIMFGGADTNLYAYVHSDPVNAVDPLGLDTVNIGFMNLGDNNNVPLPGHCEIQVNDGPWQGYYPEGLHNEEHPPQNYIPIDVTPEQAKKIKDFIDEYKNNPSKYDLFRFNCITFVREALKRAGIRVPEAGFLPGDFYITMQILSHTGQLH
jgi:RHS repeat-associated protein